MKSALIAIVFMLTAAISAQAEIRRAEIKVFGMDWGVCAHAVRVALKDIKGVDNVDVSLSKGEAVVTFATGNTVRYEQLLRAIEKNGFVVKGANVVLDGTVVGGNNNLELQVSGSGDRFRLQQASSAGSPVQMTGAVEVNGVIPEVGKGKNADVIRFTSVNEK